MKSRRVIHWIKSSYSDTETANCVEWAPSQAASHGVVPVRDSKAPDRAVLAIAPAAWACFVTALHDGELVYR
ncbi:DUF397 domain-containing protein [Streptomyces uncialis]|uniref:DUF397 domain-containing protein n=1 Tax=Streptomyces uncialis TaxID=1048205 RepID=A0A1Q4VDX1_9ACTN|nr:DUF397 domain-containing protein [Streptomyces uncialis]OKH96032.1 hypothetical protein AB852_04970 [Streptomyces uncialis]